MELAYVLLGSFALLLLTVRQLFLLWLLARTEPALRPFQLSF